jgi:hypothetical protein
VTPSVHGARSWKHILARQRGTIASSPVGRFWRRVFANDKVILAISTLAATAIGAVGGYAMTTARYLREDLTESHQGASLTVVAQAPRRIRLRDEFALQFRVRPDKPGLLGFSGGTLDVQLQSSKLRQVGDVGHLEVLPDTAPQVVPASGGLRFRAEDVGTDTVIARLRLRADTTRVVATTSIPVEVYDDHVPTPNDYAGRWEFTFGHQVGEMDVERQTKGAVAALFGSYRLHDGTSGTVVMSQDNSLRFFLVSSDRRHHWEVTPLPAVSDRFIRLTGCAAEQQPASNNAVSTRRVLFIMKAELRRPYPQLEAPEPDCNSQRGSVPAR